MSIVNHLPCSAMVGSHLRTTSTFPFPLIVPGAYVKTFFPFSLKSVLLRRVLYSLAFFVIFTRVFVPGRLLLSRLARFDSHGVGKCRWFLLPGGYFGFSGRRGGFSTTSRSSARIHTASPCCMSRQTLCPSVPAVVAAVKMAALSGSLSLTRKSLQPSHCRYLGGIDVDGHETGTVYLGKRQNADVWAKVYDKRHERLSRGFADPGSLLRVGGLPVGRWRHPARCPSTCRRVLPIRRKIACSCPGWLCRVAVSC